MLDLSFLVPMDSSSNILFALNSVSETHTHTHTHTLPHTVLDQIRPFAFGNMRLLPG